MGQDSSVGIETRYELDGQGMNSCWGSVVYSASCKIGSQSLSRE